MDNLTSAGKFQEWHSYLVEKFQFDSRADLTIKYTLNFKTEFIEKIILEGLLHYLLAFYEI